MIPSMNILTPPAVRLLGEVQHPDFRDAIALLQAGARLVDDAADVSPELIVVAQSRPGVISQHAIERLRRRWPLAAVVALLGTWCEGETRTGRPWPGVPRLYWYDFPSWWRRQLQRRAAGRCPDWARPGDFPWTGETTLKPQPVVRHCSNGVIVLGVPRRDSREAIADVLRDAGYAAVWQRVAGAEWDFHGATAGLWDGGQLDEREADDLATFCRKLARDAAPVVALLDFPRRDRVDRALELGASIVLGKPWQNDALVDAIQTAARCVNLHEAA